jgi:hypothetical protein
LYLEIPTNRGSLIISDIYLSYPLACHSVPLYIKSVGREAGHTQGQTTMRLYDARFRQLAYLAAKATADAAHTPGSSEWWATLKTAETAEMERLVKADRAEAEAEAQRCAQEDGAEEIVGDWGAWRTFTGDFVSTPWTVAHFQPEGSYKTACGREVPTDFNTEHAHESDADTRRCKRCCRALGGRA